MAWFTSFLLPSNFGVLFVYLKAGFPRLSWIGRMYNPWLIRIIIKEEDTLAIIRDSSRDMYGDTKFPLTNLPEAPKPGLAIWDAQIVFLLIGGLLRVEMGFICKVSVLQEALKSRF